MNNVELREKMFKIINVVLDNHSDSIKVSLGSDKSIIIVIDPTHTVQIVPFDEITDGYAYPMYEITFVVNNNTKCNLYSSVSIEVEAYDDDINDIIDKISEFNAKEEIDKMYKEFVKEEKK